MEMIINGYQKNSPPVQKRDEASSKVRNLLDKSFVIGLLSASLSLVIIVVKKL